MLLISWFSQIGILGQSDWIANKSISSRLFINVSWFKLIEVRSHYHTFSYLSGQTDQPSVYFDDLLRQICQELNIHLTGPLEQTY